MRTGIFVAGIAISGAGAPAAVFENAAHTGFISFSGAHVENWSALPTAATGFLSQPGHIASWDFALATPQSLVLNAESIAVGGLGAPGRSVQINNVITVSLTESADFVIEGVFDSSPQLGGVSVWLSGSGILDAPTDPDGVLRLSVNEQGWLPFTITGTMLPGVYTITSNTWGVNSPPSTGSGAVELTLTIPAAGVGASIAAGLAPLLLRRRRE